jgi:hypothetical protein
MSPLFITLIVISVADLALAVYSYRSCKESDRTLRRLFWTGVSVVGFQAVFILPFLVNADSSHTVAK